MFKKIGMQEENIYFMYISLYTTDINRVQLCDTGIAKAAPTRGPLVI